MNEGKIFLVGLGPGAAEHMSGRARRAIAAANVVIGYGKYVDLVKDLIDGKEVIRKGMTQEVDRCVAAGERARAGKTVALISSGDIGVYGMAGLTFEVLLQSGWNPGDGIGVELIPGITALSACASLVGAPLGHDFCTISLSDLLTPWPVIARRLEAAGRGDFVIALYNPRSGRRQGQLLEARRILLRDRRPDTPVAIVHSAYRERQAVQLSTLNEMTECDIGMLSTVLIGNGSTYFDAGLMITPRGYGRKYAGLTGEVKEGERSGRSLSMGFNGWKACVRRFLSDNPDQSLRQVARYFDVPLGEILEAVGEAGGEDSAGGYAAVTIRPGGEAEILEAARDWGRLRAVVRSEAGAVSELLLHASDFSRRGDWLNLTNEHFHLHIDWSRVHRGWLLRRSADLCSLYFTDARQDVVFSLSLVRNEGRFEQGVEQCFEQAWERLGVGKRQ